MDSQRVDETLAAVRTRRRWLNTEWSYRLRDRRAAAYGAGAELNDALAAAQRLSAMGIACTLGYSAREHDDARAVADMHLRAFERIGDLDGYVSIKLSELDFDAALFAELDQAAARAGRRLHIDALAPETVARTWGLLEDRARNGALGMSFPGRWRRSVGDARQAAELGATVRVVKGQWAHGADGDIDPRRGYLDVIDVLAGRASAVAVATHDPPLLAEAVGRLQRAGTPCEVELLLGLPFRAPALAARRLGVPVRLYVPYGEVGATYGMKDLTRNPAAVWWLAQDLLLGKDKTWLSIRRSRATAP